MKSASPETPDEFASQWYSVEEIHMTLKRQIECGQITRMAESIPMPPPADISSREFSEWFANQCQSAMAKGIRIGMEWQARKGGA